MKTLELVIDPNQIRYNSSIRRKKDIINITLKIISLINLQKFIVSEAPSLVLQSGKVLVSIYIDKMSRVFIIDSNKIHTFQFPFKILKDDSTIYCMHDNIQIDNVVLSVLSASFNEFNENSSIDSLLEALWGFESEFSLNKDQLEIIEKIFIFILTFESGYLRLDFDEIRENDIHPKNHLDLYYSSNNTFKIGLRNKLSHRQLIDILDVHTKCWFLKSN